MVSDNYGQSSKGPEVFLNIGVLPLCTTHDKRYTGVECVLCNWPDRGVNEGVVHGFQSSED